MDPEAAVVAPGGQHPRVPIDGAGKDEAAVVVGVLADQVHPAGSTGRQLGAPTEATLEVPHQALEILAHAFPPDRSSPVGRLPSTRE